MTEDLYEEKWLQVSPFDEKDPMTRKLAGGKACFIYKDLHMSLIMQDRKEIAIGHLYELICIFSSLITIKYHYEFLYINALCFALLSIANCKFD